MGPSSRCLSAFPPLIWIFFPPPFPFLFYQDFPPLMNAFDVSPLPRIQVSYFHLEILIPFFGAASPLLFFISRISLSVRGAPPRPASTAVHRNIDERIFPFPPHFSVSSVLPRVTGRFPGSSCGGSPGLSSLTQRLRGFPASFLSKSFRISLEPESRSFPA